MNTDQRNQRFALLRSVGCIACRIGGNLDCGLPEVHHLNLGGHAGQKRRGDEFTVPLGAWHHRGEPPFEMTATRAEELYGPSLARNSKAFRECYGSDDFLLERTNAEIANRVVDAA